MSAANQYEAWDSLGDLVGAALTNLRCDKRLIEVGCGMPYEQIRRIIRDGGSLELADKVVRMLEIHISDLSWVLRDLRATAAARTKQRLTDEALP
jgi:hypothetical protein